MCLLVHMIQCMHAAVCCLCVQWVTETNYFIISWRDRKRPRKKAMTLKVRKWSGTHFTCYHPLCYCLSDEFSYSDMDDSDFSDTEVDLEMGRRWKVTITRKENLVMQSWRGYYLKIWHLKSRKRRRSQVNVFCCSCCCCCRVQASAIVCPCCMQNCYLIKKETAGSVGMSCISMKCWRGRLKSNELPTCLIGYLYLLFLHGANLGLVPQGWWSQRGHPMNLQRTW